MNAERCAKRSVAVDNTARNECLSLHLVFKRELSVHLNWRVLQSPNCNAGVFFCPLRRYINSQRSAGYSVERCFSLCPMLSGKENSCTTRDRGHFSFKQSINQSVCPDSPPARDSRVAPVVRSAFVSPSQNTGTPQVFFASINFPRRLAHHTGPVALIQDVQRLTLV